MASYAPFYAFIVFRNRADAQVKGDEQNTKVKKISILNNPTYFHIQDAAAGADGETIAGRRIRVSHARPRTVGPRLIFYNRLCLYILTVGPRDRFIPDKYTRDRGELDFSLFPISVTVLQ